MSLIYKLVLAGVTIYLVRKVAYLLWVRERRRARDVQIGFNFFVDRDTGRKAVSVNVPIYGEQPGFRMTVGDSGIHLGYTPQGPVPATVSRVLAHKHLLQIVLNGIALPSREQVYDMGIRAFAAGIRQENGFLIYPPDLLARGALSEGVTSGTDIFLILPEFTAQTLADLPVVADLFRSRDFVQAIAYARQKIGAEGALMNRDEGWFLYHDDDSLRDSFVTELLHLAYSRLFELNGLTISENIRLMHVDDFLTDSSGIDGRPVECTLYFEDSALVTYWKQAKTYYVRTEPIHSHPTPQVASGPYRELLRYLVPEIVHDRAYSRKSLLRFSVQYLLTTAYIPAICLAIAFVIGELFPGVSEAVRLAPAFPGAILSVMSLVLSVVYGLKGLTAGRRLVRAGL
ncbi:MAG: hypothetical protein RBT76_02690 [candidate division Zixibacteria bacterium]|jgi:hypothetical protein|nr:hypothetical protein [candidate division Zixibacteria bacterium]